MATYSNSAREVEMPDGNVVVLHSEPTGGANTTSNIKKFKYDDNGHVTESTAANATDLNLNSYSTPTTGSTDIGTSDAVQTAIGKLDHQSHIDQTNILYGIRNGVKNIMQFNHELPSVYQGLSITETAEGITVKGTATGNPYSYVHVGNITIEAGETYALIDSGRSTDYCYVDSSTAFTVATPTFTQTVQYLQCANSGTYKVYFRANYNVAIDRLHTPMICLKSLYDADPTYSMGALPNYDLTRLEAEDRASLAEVVDSGAKNLLTNKGQMSHGNVTFTWNNDGSVTVSGTKTAGAECYVNVIDNVPYSNMGLKAGDTIVISNNGTNAYISVIFYASGSGYTSATTAVNEAKPVVLPTDKTNILIRLTVKSDVASVSETIKPMLCTKAAFGVSNKFVPYRPNYDLVCAAIARSNNHGLKKMVSFSTSAANTYEIITNSKITVPVNKMIRISATGMWRNSYCTGIKIQVGNDLRDNRTLAINETTTAYNGLPVIATYYNDNTNDIDLYIAARTDNTTASMLVIIYDIV